MEAHRARSKSEIEINGKLLMQYALCNMQSYYYVVTFVVYVMDIAAQPDLVGTV